jgi:hypothetical protein
MNTKMVSEARISPRSTVDEGADAIVELATMPLGEDTSGAFFDA